MKYLTKSYAAFLYTALLSLLTYAFLGGGDFDIRADGEFITLMDARGLLWLAFVFGLIWLLYIGQDAFLYSKKLTWLHYVATCITLIALCWYRAQGGVGKYVGLLLLALVAAQGFFIAHVVKGKTYRY